MSKLMSAGDAEKLMREARHIADVATDIESRLRNDPPLLCGARIDDLVERAHRLLDAYCEAVVPSVKP